MIERSHPTDADAASVENAHDRIERAVVAGRSFAKASQEEVDAIVDAMAHAADVEAESLARLAVDETGMGRVDSKVDKNLFVTRHLHERYRHLKTCGVVSRDPERGVMEIAAPVGVVAGIIPCTNPTSTAIFKGMIAVKSRNPIVLSPHPSAERCIAESTRVIAEAAVRAGAPEGLISCMTAPTLAGTHALMKHPDTAVIVATGGPGVVQAAYSSGKPAFGVGPGNAPVFVHRSADPEHTARSLVLSQNFDYGTICSSEQALVVEDAIADALRTALEAQGAHFCSPSEAKRLADTVQTAEGQLNTAIVGRSPQAIAELAGIEVAPRTTVLIAPESGVGRDFPLSREKLAPILAWYTTPDWRSGCKLCLEILSYGGTGHTLGIHARDASIVEQFALEKPVARMIVNGPTTQGAIGLATGLAPSMTLGCGTMGGNITTDNIGPRHLLSIKRVAYPRAEFFRDHGLPLATEDHYPTELHPEAYEPTAPTVANRTHSGYRAEDTSEAPIRGAGPSVESSTGSPTETTTESRIGARTPPSRRFYLRNDGRDR